MTAPEERRGSNELTVVALIEDSNFGGPAKNLLRFAVNARAVGTGHPIAVRLITFTRRGRRPSPLVAACRDRGIQVDEVVERHRFDISAIRELRRVVLGARPAIIQTHNVKSHLFAVVSGLRRSIPWVAFSHGYTRVTKLQQWYDKLDRFTLPRADRIVAVCGAFRDELCRQGVSQSKISVLHNSIESSTPRRESGVLSSIRDPANGGQIAVIGRLSIEKGHSFLLRAFSKLVKLEGLSKTRLIVLGEGPERGPLEREADRLGLSNAVTFMGHVRNPSHYLRSASVLALPSMSEGSPNVVLEAMECGVPVVATSVGGVPEIIRDSQNGLLVPYGDEMAMTRALEAILKSDRLANDLAKNARHDIDTLYSPSAYAARMWDVYQLTLQHARASRGLGVRN